MSAERHASRKRSRSRERHRDDQPRHRVKEEDRRHHSDRDRPERRVKEEPWPEQPRHGFKQEPFKQEPQPFSRGERPGRRPDNERSAGHEIVDLPPPPAAQHQGRSGPARWRFERSEDLSGMQWGKPRQEEEVPGGRRREEQPEPEANFELSGKLAAESNRVNGVVLQHQEPLEARKPTHRWRLYVFKGGEPMGEPLYIHRQSYYLIGRERRVVDIATDHPSCSKQHAVLQFRLTEVQGVASVRPYIMDLGSVNGTWLNRERIEPERYLQLLEQDMLKFGNSSREYILLHDKSQGGTDA